MMKQKISLFTLASIALGGVSLLCLEACSKPAEASADADAEGVAFSRINTSASYRLVGSASDYEAAADLSFDCMADILMPVEVYGNDITALQDSIFNQAFDTVAADHRALINDIFRNNAASLGYAVADTTVTDRSYDGLYNVVGSVESLSAKILSYAITVSNYMPGAAHGFYYTSYVNYDAQAGKVFSVNDIFTTEGLAKLPEMLKTIANDMRGYIGRTQIENIPQGGNFCISADGNIVFVYRPYEVASYAQGQIRIPVAPYVVSAYLTPYGNKLLMGVE